MLKIVTGLGLLIVLLTPCASAFDALPEVYRDDYVSVRSAVLEFGKQPINIGDGLTLAIEVDFTIDEVLVENLTEDVFRRNWGGEKGLVLIRPPEISTIKHGNGAATLRGLYPFAVLDCPGGLSSCPGNKVYPLPVISFGYQIVDEAGRVVNTKSIRFNSQPGLLTLTQVLPIHYERLGEFSEYFPNGAYSGSLAFSGRDNNGLLTALIGGLLLLAGFMPALFVSRTTQRVDIAKKSGKRWSNLLILAEDETRLFSDEEWADLIRRCAVSYCMDEHGVNPYDWLNSADAAQPQSLQAFKSWFLELLNCEAIDKTRRAGFTSGLRQLTGLPAVPLTQDAAA